MLWGVLEGGFWRGTWSLGGVRGVLGVYGGGGRVLGRCEGLGRGAGGFWSVYGAAGGVLGVIVEG